MTLSLSGSTPAGTPLEDLGCPHCGKTCDVCVDMDAEAAQLRSDLQEARAVLGAVIPLLTPEQAAEWQERCNHFRAERAAARARA